MKVRLNYFLKIVICLLLISPKSYSQHDVLVYGATPAGIFAAVNAAKSGNSVLLVEEYEHIGGLMTGGLSFSDFISTEGLSGDFNDYRFRVMAYYQTKYGVNSKQVKDSYFGVNAEPHVTLQIFHGLLKEHQVKVLTRHVIVASSVNKLSEERHQITSVSFKNLQNNKRVDFSAKVFIDATYEGDLAVAAGAEYRIGREDRTEFCERFAGHIFTDKGQILTGGTGQADAKVQAYNFRIIMTDSAENRIMIQKPDHYKREDYLPILEAFHSGKVSEIFTEDATGILRVQPLVNRKADINDIKNAAVRLSSLGRNYDYPNGTREVRQRIIQEHKQHILGMIYFLQNDEGIPLHIRQKARVWGMAKDEFTDNDHFPYRLYIREARRIMGNEVFTEHNTYQAANSIRSVLNTNSVAVGDYALNCHGVSAPGPIYPDKTEGDFSFVPQPFQIPYGVMLPKHFTNLIVPVAISSSHVGFCGIRLEPTWSSLGQAAGIAASLSIRGKMTVDQVNIADIQSILLKRGGKLIYISDVEADSPYFEATQYYGTKGFFHDLYHLHEMVLKPRVIHKLQYRDASQYHDFQPNTVLTKTLANSWIKQLPPTEREDAQRKLSAKSWTRGEFLNELYQNKMK